MLQSNQLAEKIVLKGNIANYKRSVMSMIYWNYKCDKLGLNLFIQNWSCTKILELSIFR